MPSMSVQLEWYSREEAREKALQLEGSFSAGDRAILWRRGWVQTSTSDERAIAHAYNQYEAIARMARFLSR